jgi:hypothetical protein
VSYGSGAAALRQPASRSLRLLLRRGFLGRAFTTYSATRNPLDKAHNVAALGDRDFKALGSALLRRLLALSHR